jgi:hypothetical protein
MSTPTNSSTPAPTSFPTSMPTSDSIPVPAFVSSSVLQTVQRSVFHLLPSVPSCNQLHLRQLPLLEHPLETQLASLSSPTSHIILFLIKQLDGLLDIEVDVLIGEAAAARAWWISEVGVCWKRSGCKMWIDDGRHIWGVDVGN